MSTKTQHTPGPWKHEDGIIMSTVPIPGGCAMKPGTFRIADVRGWGHLQYRPDGEAMQEANGRLLAAAPALLEALREMVRMYEEVQPAGGWQGVYEEAVAALALATNAPEGSGT